MSQAEARAMVNCAVNNCAARSNFAGWPFLAYLWILFLALCSCSSADDPGVDRGATPADAAVEQKQAATGQHPLQKYADRPGGPLIFEEGLISTADYELNASFSQDCRRLYFCKANPRFSFWAIFSTVYEDGVWSAPDITAFSGRYRDVDPFLSPDEQRLYFASDRPRGADDERRDFDIWYVEQQDGVWSEARNAGAVVNSEQDEYYPCAVGDGSLYFASLRRPDRGFDIYRAQRVNNNFLEPLPVAGAINSEYHEMDVFVPPDENYCIFTAYGRPDSQGEASNTNGDLYFSSTESGVWQTAVNLGGRINSPAREFCPQVAPGGEFFLFSSDRGFGDRPPQRRLSTSDFVERARGVNNGLGNIYIMQTADLMSLSGQNP